MGVKASNAAAIERLRRALTGELITASDVGYDDARRVWNAAIDRYPALVARCAGPADVILALRFARDRELPVAVRCGGHSVAGHSTCDGGVVIDLSPMRAIEIDPEARRARVQGGALLRDLDMQAQRFGLACPTGVVGHTGVGGLTLGGGLGRLSRAHGLSIDNLVSVDLVTVDGRQVRASEDENSDLFWGMRGAGANFGIVTAFEFRLQEIGTTMFSGAAVYPIGRAREIGAVFNDWAADAPRAVVGKLFFTRLPLGAGVPESIAGRPIVLAGAGAIGPTEEAERAVSPLRDLGPLLDTFAPTPYLDLQSSSDETMAWGRRYFWKGLFLDDFPPAAVEEAAARLLDDPGIEATIGPMTLGGAIGDVDEDATAFSGRAARFWHAVETGWEDPAGDERHTAWTRKAMAAFRPFASGRNYVNDLNESDLDGVRQAYGPKKHDRLVALKREWDPGNVLHLNQNIRP
jgi:FAD/FMN-containing dehydrogenase